MDILASFAALSGESNQTPKLFAAALLETFKRTI